MQQLEAWLVNFTGESYLLIAEIFLIVLAAMTAGFLATRILDFLQKRALKTSNFWDDALIEACRRPAVWAIWILGVNYAAAVAARQAGSEWYELLAPINRVVIIFLAALFLLNLIKRAELLCHEISSLELLYQNKPLPPITASFGVAYLHNTLIEKADIIKAADIALYEAKNNGRDQVVVSTTEFVDI